MSALDYGELAEDYLYNLKDASSALDRYRLIHLLEEVHKHGFTQGDQHGWAVHRDNELRKNIDEATEANYNGDEEDYNGN